MILCFKFYASNHIPDAAPDKALSPESLPANTL
jgi:hypothetical protein